MTRALALRALAFVLLLATPACLIPEDEPGDQDAQSCCWLWPDDGAIAECVMEHVEPGCVVLECWFGYEQEVCYAEETP